MSHLVLEFTVIAVCCAADACLLAACIFLEKKMGIHYNMPKENEEGDSKWLKNFSL